MAVGHHAASVRFGPFNGVIAPAPNRADAPAAGRWSLTPARARRAGGACATPASQGRGWRLSQRPEGGHQHHRSCAGSRHQHRSANGLCFSVAPGDHDSDGSAMPRPHVSVGCLTSLLKPSAHRQLRLGLEHRNGALNASVLRPAWRQLRQPLRHCGQGILSHSCSCCAVTTAQPRRALLGGCPVVWVVARHAKPAAGRP